MNAQTVLVQGTFETASVAGSAIGRGSVDATATAGGRAGGGDTVKLRLTRRGRVVFGGLATVLVAGLLAFIAALGAPQAIASDAEGGQQFAYAVVQPGSSLWSLATELDPSADPRDLVAEIVQLNQLEGSGVDAGQPLAVPLRYSESPAVVSADELGI